MTHIDTVYFDHQLYAIYRAVWERWAEEAWYVVWRSGEVLFDLIEPELDFQPDDDPVTAMQRLATYLRRAGYVRDIAVHPVGEDEWEYEMVDPVILPGAERLLSVGAVPAHVSTTLMFALLKKRFGMSAEMLGDPILRPDGRATERWRLV